MAEFEEIEIWYAKSIAENGFSDAANNSKIQNITSGDEAISLISCLPEIFAKRITDVSQALATDNISPDTGTAKTTIKVVLAQIRTTTSRTNQVLGRLINMFYLKGNDNDFQFGRFGIKNTDSPELNVVPTKLAGYKLIAFYPRPNEDIPGTISWEIILQFLGDHTRLGSTS